MRRSAFMLIILSISVCGAAAAADALPPPQCPHTIPTNGSACRGETPAACTYSSHGSTQICTCRDGHWRCEDMPPPPS